MNVAGRLRLLRKPAFQRNVAILKSYGGHKYKLVRCSCVRTRGVELPEGHYTAKGTVNNEKLSNNIIRARSKIQEYVLCNPFDFFCTFTIDPAKYDSFHLKEYHKSLTQWIRDYNKKYGLHIQYIFIPEKHESGAWHEHGFIMGLPLDHLTPFTLDEKLPYHIRGKIQRGEPIYNWLPYARKFGFVDIEPIRSRERAASYVTKYVTKDLERSVTDIGAHLFYCSKGLQRAMELKRGTTAYDFPPDFENKYCKVNWFDGRRNSTTEMELLIVSEKERTIHNDT